MVYYSDGKPYTLVHQLGYTPYITAHYYKHTSYVSDSSLLLKMLSLYNGTPRWVSSQLGVLVCLRRR